MQTIKVQMKGDFYSCDIGITKEEWLAILLDKETKDSFIEALLCFYYMPNHRGSCSAVGKKMGKKASSLNMLISKFGGRVKKIFKDRFEVVGTDGKPTFWIIPMNNGRGLSSNEEGTFEWELRQELADAIEEYLYRYLVEQYKKLRREIPIYQDGYGYELYKWQLITASQGKSVFQIVSDHVAHSGTASLGGFENLIDASRDNKTLKYLVTEKPEAYELILNRLIDENVPLVERLAEFKSSVISLLPSKGYNSKANDERTAATILTCVNPDRYTFYKHDGLYENFCKYLGKSMEKAGVCYSHYLSLIQPLIAIVKNDAELQEIVSPYLLNMRHCDTLLAQDILWTMMVTFTSRLGFIYNLLFNTNKDMDNNKINEYIELLKSNHNLILTGAPGTGKTYLAKEIAKAMGCSDEQIGFVQFHPSYDYTDFVEGLRPTNDKNGNVGFIRKDGVFKDFCKNILEKKSTYKSEFNISRMDEYVDILRRCAIKDYPNYYQNEIYPLLKRYNSNFEIIDNRLVYRFPFKTSKQVKFQYLTIDKDVLLRFLLGCQIANDNPKYKEIAEIVKRITSFLDNNDNKAIDKYNRPFVFIIDEINRGEISKIFGELFFSIDPGYRGEKGKVNTQYQNMIDEGDVFKNGFYVPKNVYIIGTMNDIDRSVESMDFAMRRRFAWKEVTAEESMEMLKDEPQELKGRMTRVNDAILKVNGLGKAYQIGAAYFLKCEEYEYDYEKLWQYHLEGLLKEYLRGNSNADAQLKELKKAYDSTVTNNE